MDEKTETTDAVTDDTSGNEGPSLPDEAELSPEDESPEPRRFAEEEADGIPVGVKGDWQYDRPAGEEAQPPTQWPVTAGSYLPQGRAREAFDPGDMASRPRDRFDRTPVKPSPREAFVSPSRRAPGWPDAIERLAAASPAELTRLAFGLSVLAIGAAVFVGFIGVLLGSGPALAFASVLTVCGFVGVGGATWLTSREADAESADPASPGREPGDASAEE